MLENEDEEEEKTLKKYIDKQGEDQAAMRKIKKLEQKVENLGNSVYQLFQRYDQQMQQLIKL